MDALCVRLGLPQPDRAVTGLELTTTLKRFYPLEPFENVALRCDRAGTFEAAMLGHKMKIMGFESFPGNRAAETSERRQLRKRISQRRKADRRDSKGNEVKNVPRQVA